MVMDLRLSSRSTAAGRWTALSMAKAVAPAQRRQRMKNERHMCRGSGSVKLAAQIQPMLIHWYHEYHDQLMTMGTVTRKAGSRPRSSCTRGRMAAEGRPLHPHQHQ